MNSHLHLVVMAGGSGTRFWPKSTSKKPKQLLAFGSGKRTLLEETLERFSGWVSERIIVATHALSKEVDAASKKAGGARVLAEPTGRNTAPCIYWAAREVASRDCDGIMLVMPSDHEIADVPKFVRTVQAAAEWADGHDDLVTLGVKPTGPETGYGYLKLGGEIDGSPCRHVEAFVEKPDFARATEYFQSGEYLWNGGMFVWRAEIILRAFDEFMPEMGRAWEAARGNVADAYPKMTAQSIDYGIMEKSKKVVTFPLDCGWDDLGTWPSLERVAERWGAVKECGVVTSGQALSIDSKGNIVDAPGRLVALLGVDDLIVVESGDAILVAKKERAQDIKQIVERVKKEKPELA